MSGNSADAGIVLTKTEPDLNFDLVVTRNDFNIYMAKIFHQSATRTFNGDFSGFDVDRD